MSKSLPPHFSAHGGQFLHYPEVGSSIQWAITVTQYERTYGTYKGLMDAGLQGTMKLTDCSRSIDWGISDEGDLKKLDRAIESLTVARTALRKALKLYVKHKLPEEE